MGSSPSPSRRSTSSHPNSGNKGQTIMPVNRSGALALLAGGVLATTRPAAAQADLPLVRIGTDPIDSFGEAYFGADRGIFRDNGVNVQVNTFANGSTIVQGVAGG